MHWKPSGTFTPSRRRCRAGRRVARAFVAMPFAEEFDGLWRAIRSACAACRVSATRVDQSHAHENIWDEVCATITSTDFTIAVAAPDATRIPNPNVMLEIGYARALGKPVLLLTDAPETLPFDLRTQRALSLQTRACRWRESSTGSW